MAPPLIVAMAAMTAASGVASYMSMSQQAAAEKANAALAERNRIAAIEASQVRAQESDFQTRAQIGEQIAGQGMSGLSGKSQRLVRGAAAERGRQDALNIRSEGDTQGLEYSIRAYNAKRAARAAKFQGLSNMLGKFAEAGSIVGNAKGMNR